MIGCGESAVWSANFTPGVLQAFKRLRRCDLVHKMPV